MLRALWYVPATLIWCVLVLPLAILAALFTFGRLNHKLINVFGPLWAGGLLWIFGVRLRVIGFEHIAEPRARLLMMNHESLIDMLSVAYMNPPHVMAMGKKEFLYMPLIGQAWWALGQALIDRSNRERAIASLSRVAATLHDPPRNVVIFPEGTRSRTGQLQPFKLGAFHMALEAKVPIVPMVIYDAYARQVPDSIRVIPGEVTIVIHPERDTSHWTRETIHAEADALRAEYVKWIAEGPPSG